MFNLQQETNFILKQTATKTLEGRPSLVKSISRLGEKIRLALKGRPKPKTFVSFLKVTPPFSRQHFQTDLNHFVRSSREVNICRIYKYIYFNIIPLDVISR